jgi:hypothetical protein
VKWASHRHTLSGTGMHINEYLLTGIEEAIETIANEIRKNGPYDGVMGFS